MKQPPFQVGDIFDFTNYVPPGYEGDVGMKIKIDYISFVGMVNIRVSEGPDAPFRIVLADVPYERVCRLIRDGIWTREAT